MEKCVILEFIKDKCQKKKSNYHHGNLKEELLQQAVQLIHEKGVDALTLQVLASKLGTSRSAIYRHFSSKNELMHNVMLYGFSMFDETISPIFEQKNESVEKRLYLMGKEYIKFALEHPNLYRMLFGEKFQDIREDGCDIEDEEQATGFHALIALLIEGQEKKEFRVQDPMSQAQTIHAMVHGLSSLCIDGHIHFSDKIDDLFEVYFKTMTQGLLIRQ